MEQEKHHLKTGFSKLDFFSIKSGLLSRILLDKRKTGGKGVTMSLQIIPGNLGHHIVLILMMLATS